MILCCCFFLIFHTQPLLIFFFFLQTGKLILKPRPTTWHRSLFLQQMYTIDAEYFWTCKVKHCSGVAEWRLQHLAYHLMAQTNMIRRFLWNILEKQFRCDNNLNIHTPLYWDFLSFFAIFLLLIYSQLHKLVKLASGDSVFWVKYW